MPDSTTTTEEKPKSDKAQAIEKSGQSIEMAIRECGVLAVRQQPPFMQAVRMAYGIKTIKEALPDKFMHDNFMPLQNSALGFLTDKPDGYPVEVVREALCEALLRGFMPVNNEFNIISGRCYGTKNGYERLVHEYPGIQGLAYELGVPQLAGDKGALVTCSASWYIDGVQDTLQCLDKSKEKDGVDSRIPVKVNGGMGADGILGKATRKMFYRIYKKLLGQAVDTAEEDATEVPTTLSAPALPSQDGRRIKLGGDKKNVETAADPAPAAPAPAPAAKPEPTEAEKLAAEAAADEKAHATK